MAYFFASAVWTTASIDNKAETFGLRSTECHKRDEPILYLHVFG
jgi:hypothetical protein